MVYSYDDATCHEMPLEAEAFSYDTSNSHAYDANSTLSYYGFRFYSPETGRWPSRDPMEEKADLNLYLFAKNDSFNQIDLLGQFSCSIKVIPDIPPKQTNINYWDFINNIDAPIRIVIHNGLCTLPCTLMHEMQHCNDRSDCYRRVSRAYHKAWRIQKKMEISDWWRDYINKSEAWSECRAYDKSVKCARNLILHGACKCIAEDYLKKAEEAKASFCAHSEPPPPCKY